MGHTVGPKGQVVIEKRIRRQLGVEPGWQTLQSIVDGHVQIDFIPPEHNRSLAGILADKTKVRIGDDEDAWHRAMEIAHEAMARDAMGLDAADSD